MTLQTLLMYRAHVRDKGWHETRAGACDQLWASLRCAEHQRHLTLQEISLILLRDQIEEKMA